MTHPEIEREYTTIDLVERAKETVADSHPDLHELLSQIQYDLFNLTNHVEVILESSKNKDGETWRDAMDSLDELANKTIRRESEGLQEQITEYREEQ